MKKTNLQKIALTTMALVASLALAQAGKPMPTSGTHHKRALSFSPRGTVVGLPQPKLPEVVLYDQYDNLSTAATFSGTFSDFVGFNADDADDFVVPAGQSWTIDSIDADGLYFNGAGPANSWNVFVYADNGGIPGAIIASQMNLPASVSGTTFSVNFSPSVTVAGGHYWVEIQANLTFATEGQWGWTDRTVQSNSPAAWQNPGGGFGLCPSWNTKSICVAGAGPDNVFRLNGTTGGPTPTPTPTATPTPTPPGNALWYNGDFDGVNGLANQENVAGSGQYAHVYDDFIVTDSSGWDVTSVFSNDLSATNITGATWEIRQGVSSGNGGTIVAQGMTATPMVTATGRSGFGFTEYTVQVNGISVHLDSASGNSTYWLNVAPIGDASGQAYDSTTMGANCIGIPCGNDGMAYFDSDFFGFNFVLSDDPSLGNGRDFSMGVNGTVTGSGGGLSLASSASRLAQGTGGSFDVPLPGVEGRYAPSRDLIVFTFNEDVSGASGATTSCGTVQSVTVDPNNSKNLIVKITALSCDKQTVTVTVNGVTATNGDSLATASTQVSFLFGDVTGDGSVNNQDINAIRAAMGQRANSSNFRADLNGDGAINNKDIGVFKTFRGDHL